MLKTSSMSDITRLRVVKTDSNLFTVDTPDGLCVCKSRKAVKNKSDIVVGDFVTIDNESGESVISSVLERFNYTIRPLVSNIDQLVIVVAPVPITDWFLIDKLIINANRQGIETVICLNKYDTDESVLKSIKKQYSGVVGHIIKTSAISGNIKELTKLLKGKLSSFAGQSAVGKSTLINALLGSDKQKTGGLSRKSERGKNTTTRAEIVKLEQNTYIIDTPGFSMLDIHYIDHNDFDLYYDEYVSASESCKFRRCSHTNEPDCNVKKLVENGTLDKDRYARYLVMKKVLKDTKDQVKSYEKRL